MSQLSDLQAKLPSLTKGQVFWLSKVVDNYARPYRARLLATTLLNEAMLQDFGDALRTHQGFSQEPCSKDKFEYILQQVCESNGVPAQLASKGNPGHDITINHVPFSLKSQADSGIKPDRIWISKFHELGKGDWSDQPGQLKGLLAQFLAHLTHYERIFTLRCLRRAPDWHYQLVEIPKTLLAKAATGTLEMRLNSTQMPKPGYCHVEECGIRLFSLYFDGGTERKLQVKDLLVTACIVHAEWQFTAPAITQAVSAPGPSAAGPS